MAWRKAVAGFDVFPHVWERARSQARLADALRAAGDRDEARTLNESARAIATRLGATPLLAQLGPAGRGSSIGQVSGAVDLLTPRELEVLTLVAEGRSNRENGERLFISVKTASVHVSNILAKLVVKSRTDAASVAQRRGLLDD